MIFHIFTCIFHHLRVYQLPVGLKVQLVKHCTGIVESWFRIPFEPEVSVFQALISHFKFNFECITGMMKPVSEYLSPQFKYVLLLSNCTLQSTNNA